MSQPEISYVLNGRWPTIKAFGIQVAKMCQGFQQAGARIHLVVPIRAWHQEQKGKTVWELYGIRDRFRLIRIPSLDVTRLHLTNWVFFWTQQILFALCALPVVMMRKGPVYSRDPFTLYLVSFFGKDLFWEVHRMPENPSSSVYQRLFRRVRGFIAITGALKQDLIAAGAEPHRILVAPDGIDLAETDSIQQGDGHQRSLGLNPATHTVGYVGHMLPWKGVDTFVDAAQLLDERFQVFVVGGLPWEVERLRQRDGKNRIRWVGYVPHADALQWIAAADTVVLPNRKDGGISERYTSPLKMFEYMALGKRIVASDLPSIREVLSEQNAFLVTPDDPAALAQGIYQAAERQDDAKQRALQARQDVQQYAWDKRAHRILQFIHGLSH